MKRKCIYTNKDAKSKDSIIPRQLLGSEMKNWSIEAPCSEDYLREKTGRLPTELELQANEVFHLLELARIRVRHYELKLEEIQAEILKNYKAPEPKAISNTAEKKKEKEITQAELQKQIVENKIADEFLDKKRKLWNDETE